ncbi:AMP-binding protein, partial [Janthinobacterium sp. FT14W]|uniref:AMP-binding protein n=1 Tax=Janthinobacterium sp. FT14W TaxID=2654253 RepID=UPI001264D686
TGISKFDLSLEVTEAPHGLSCIMEYSTTLFKPETIARLCRHFAAMCGAIAAAPDAALDALQYVGTHERHQLLDTFNATASAYAHDRCIHELFAEQAAATPESIAVSFGTAQLSYAQLHDKCDYLAQYLQSMGIGADDLVGLYMERSLELMVGLMGTLMAGGAYVPLDPDYPQERLAYMLQDTQAKVILTQATFKEQLRELTGPDT